MVAELMEGLQMKKYLERSFCIFELYAANVGGCNLIMYTRLSRHQMEEALEETRSVPLMRLAVLKSTRR